MEDNTVQYIVAVLGKELYGFEVGYIDSIIEMQAITRVPASQKDYLGIINLRGDIIPIISLRRKFNLTDDEFTEYSRIVIVRPDPESEAVGLLVDDINEVITINKTDIDTFSYDEDDAGSRYNTGVGKHKGYLINLLNIPRIVIDEQVS